MEAISLYELNNRIKQTLKASFADSVWITAEITEVQLNRSGHCYLQLADKREQEDSIVATAGGRSGRLPFVRCVLISRRQPDGSWRKG